MAKKDKMLAGLGNLNIDKFDDILDKSKEEKVKIDNVEYLINYLQLGNQIITLKKEKGSKKEWEVVESSEIDKELLNQLQLKNAKGYAIQTKTATKVQTGIYLDNNVDAYLKLYLFQLNAYLAVKNGKTAKKVTRAALIDNILYDFLVQNELFKTDFNSLLKRKDELWKLGENMLQVTYKGLPLKSVLFSKRTKNGLYLTLDIFESIVGCSDFIFAEDIGGKALFVNNIFKNWFLKNEIATPNIFVGDFKSLAEAQFSPTAFKNYFELENKITDDNHKLTVK